MSIARKEVTKSMMPANKNTVQTGQLRRDRTFTKHQDEKLKGKDKNLTKRPSSCITTSRDLKFPNNRILKSHYCAEEVKKKDFCKRNSVNTNEQIHKKIKQDDIKFLKQLLALNKQEEILINKRLAKLTTEEGGLSNQGERNGYRGRNQLSLKTHSYYSSYSTTNNKVINERTLLIENTPRQNLLSNNNKNVGYHISDLEGRLILSETFSEEEEYFDCEKTMPMETSNIDGLIVDSNHSIKTQSDDRKVANYSLTQRSCKAKSTNFEYDKKKSDMRHNLVEEELRMKKSPLSISENRLKREKILKHACDQSQGDGVQNDRLHYSKVLIKEYSEKKKSKLLKVWNFNDIPKTKPTNVLVSNKGKNVSSSIGVSH